MTTQTLFANWYWAHWQVLLWAANAGWYLSELWIFARDFRRRPKGASSDRGSLLVILAAIAVSVEAAMWCQAHYAFARLPDGEIGAVRFAGGLGLMWIGIILRQWAVATLGKMFRTTVVVQDDHQLITRGVYRHLRNPSYAGALLTVFGQGLTFGNWLSLLVIVGGVLAAFAWRIHVEERALRGRFGQAFDDYAKASWAIIPFVW